MSADSHAKPQGIGRYLFEDGPPVPAHLAAQAAPFVDRAVLGLKDFRKDFEKIGSAVVKAKTDGTLSQDDATLIWFDAGQVVSQPLVARYCDAHAFDPVDRWIRGREGFPCTGWLTGYVLLALDRFVAAGEGQRTAALALAHGERAVKNLRQVWKERRKKVPAALTGETREVALAMQRALVARIPLRNADMLNELGELVPWVAHGSEADRAALAALQEEVRADQQRFPAQ